MNIAEILKLRETIGLLIPMDLFNPHVMLEQWSSG